MGRGKWPGILFVAFYVFMFVSITAINFSMVKMTAQVEDIAESLDQPVQHIENVRPLNLQNFVIPDIQACSPEPVSPSPEVIYSFDEVIVVMLAKLIVGEGGNVKSITEQAAIVWNVLNRVDSDNPYWPDDIESVILQANQYSGYLDDLPVFERYKDLAVDVLTRWLREHNGETEVGRVLPLEYTFFTGDGTRNYFRKSYEDVGEYWDWSLPSPYDS